MKKFKAYMDADGCWHVEYNAEERFNNRQRLALAVTAINAPVIAFAVGTLGFESILVLVLFGLPVIGFCYYAISGDE